MPLRLRKDLLDELRAFVRAEITTRRTWHRRGTLGRRLAFAVIERAILSGWWSAMTRTDEEARQRFAQRILDALDECGALDYFSAGKWAETFLDDPMHDTRKVSDRGQQTWDGRDEIRRALDRRRRSNVR
jgi:hypothetical protein